MTYALGCIEKIHAAGMKSGIAIKPGTALNDELFELARKVDLFLVMTVEPGFGGQKFN